ncbi:MAG: hypothetical protein ACTSWN_07715, partial [Promethearchaeota archaeon]
MKMAKINWEKLSTRKVGDFKIFEIIERTYLNSRNNQQFPAFIINSSNWVNIIATDDDGKI